MSLQTGTGLVLAYKKESTFGTLPTNDSSAKQLRRTKFDLSLKKTMIRSKEIRKDRQRPAGRHGMRTVDGSIGGELSLGTYADFIGSVLRKDFASVSTLSALTNVTASATAPHFVRASGSWISDGLRAGMTIRMSGWTTTGAGNNSKNYTILALTSANITVAETVAAKASGDSVVVSIPGKVSYVPLTGHTNDSYAVENWAADVSQSLRFLGQKPTRLSISLMPDAAVELEVGFMGQDRAKSTSQYFTSATAAGTTQMQTGLSGAIYVNGTAYGVLTEFKLEVNGNHETKGVVGSNLTPDVFPGSVDVSGSFSVLWQDGVLDDVFDNETEVPIVIKLLDSNAANADFMTIALPYSKLAGGSQPDAEKAIVQSFDFVSRVGSTTTGGWEATTVQIQDSLA